MDIDKTNKWLTLVGNFGVIAGIIFLGVEIHQNTSMMQAQTRNSMTENQITFYEQIVGSSEVTDLWYRAGNSMNKIERPGAEMERVAFITLIQLRMWENEWYQYRQGLFEAEEFEDRLQLWQRGMRRESHRVIWAGSSKDFSRDFRERIDSLIAEDQQ